MNSILFYYCNPGMVRAELQAAGPGGGGGGGEREITYGGYSKFCCAAGM